jgi:hypothetical protein
MFSSYDKMMTIEQRLKKARKEADIASLIAEYTSTDLKEQCKTLRKCTRKYRTVATDHMFQDIANQEPVCNTYLPLLEQYTDKTTFLRPTRAGTCPDLDHWYTFGDCCFKLLPDALAETIVNNDVAALEKMVTIKGVVKSNRQNPNLFHDLDFTMSDILKILQEHALAPPTQLAQYTDFGSTVLAESQTQMSEYNFSGLLFHLKYDAYLHTQYHGLSR